MNVRHRAVAVLLAAGLMGPLGAQQVQAQAQAPGKAQASGPKIMYYIDDTAGQVSKALIEISNLLATTPAAQVSVVTHANGVDFLLKGAKDAYGRPYATQVAQLKAKGVKFEVCELTINERNLNKTVFVPDASFTPSDQALVADLTNKGYSYRKP